jgi:hypothetical protein
VNGARERRREERRETERERERTWETKEATLHDTPHPLTWLLTIPSYRSALQRRPNREAASLNFERGTTGTVQWCRSRVKEPRDVTNEPLSRLSPS